MINGDLTEMPIHVHSQRMIILKVSQLLSHGEYRFEVTNGMAFINQHSLGRLSRCIHGRAGFTELATVQNQ